MKKPSRSTEIPLKEVIDRIDPHPVKGHPMSQALVDLRAAMGDGGIENLDHLYMGSPYKDENITTLALLGAAMADVSPARFAEFTGVTEVAAIDLLGGIATAIYEGEKREETKV